MEIEIPFLLQGKSKPPTPTGPNHYKFNTLPPRSQSR